MPILFLFFVLLLFVSGCQPLSLQGKVVDWQDNPLPGATVAVKRAGIEAMRTASDSFGRFGLSALRLNDTIEVRLPGYAVVHNVFSYPLTQHPVISIVLRRP